MNVSRSGFQNCPAPESTIDIFPLPNTWLNEQAAIKNRNRVRCKGKMRPFENAQFPESPDYRRSRKNRLPSGSTVTGLLVPVALRHGPEMLSAS